MKGLVADLRQAFERERIFQVELGDAEQDAQLNAAIVGQSASLVIFTDSKRQQTYKPDGHLDRSRAQQVLERFLTHGERDPSCEWLEVDLPFAQAPKRGCLGTAALLAAVVLVIWQSV